MSPKRKSVHEFEDEESKGEWMLARKSESIVVAKKRVTTAEPRVDIGRIMKVLERNYNGHTQQRWTSMVNETTTRS